MKNLKIIRSQSFSRSHNILKIYFHMLTKSLFVLRLLIKSFTPLKIYLHLFKNALLQLDREDLAWEIKNKFLEEKIKLFSIDWFTQNITKWIYIFKRCNLTNKNSLEILEIGSHEGMSALFFMETFSRANLTCVDIWQKVSTEKRFDRNIRAYIKRIRKIRSNSSSFFANHTASNHYDIIYIDGSHYADDVLTDAVFAFNLLKKDGILIFDDYLWQFYPDIRNNPAAAINLFLKLKADSLKIIFVGYQIAIQKR